MEFIVILIFTHPSLHFVWLFHQWKLAEVGFWIRGSCVLERLYQFVLPPVVYDESVCFSTPLPVMDFTIFSNLFKVWQMKSNTSILFYLVYFYYFVRSNIFWYIYFTILKLILWIIFLCILLICVFNSVICRYFEAQNF